MLDLAQVGNCYKGVSRGMYPVLSFLNRYFKKLKRIMTDRLSPLFDSFQDLSLPEISLLIS